MLHIYIGLLLLLGPPACVLHGTLGSVGQWAGGIHPPLTTFIRVTTTIYLPWTATPLTTLISKKFSNRAVLNSADDNRKSRRTHVLPRSLKKVWGVKIIWKSALLSSANSGQILHKSGLVFLVLLINFGNFPTHDESSTVGVCSGHFVQVLDFVCSSGPSSLAGLRRRRCSYHWKFFRCK